MLLLHWAFNICLHHETLACLCPRIYLNLYKRFCRSSRIAFLKFFLLFFSVPSIYPVSAGLSSLPFKFMEQASSKRERKSKIYTHPAFFHKIVCLSADYIIECPVYFIVISLNDIKFIKNYITLKLNRTLPTWFAVGPRWSII